MITPEAHARSEKLSQDLRTLGHHFAAQLPESAASLLLHGVDGRLYLDVYDRAGKFVGTYRSDQASPLLREALERLAQLPWPDNDGIVAIL